jgi:hypothetical protein
LLLNRLLLSLAFNGQSLLLQFLLKTPLLLGLLLR